MRRHAPLCDHSRQHRDHVLVPKTSPHSQRQTFPGEFIHHAQKLQSPSVASLVAHKIVAPYFVGPRRHPALAAVLARAQAPLLARFRGTFSPSSRQSRCSRLTFTRSLSWRIWPQTVRYPARGRCRLNAFNRSRKRSFRVRLGRVPPRAARLSHHCAGPTLAQLQFALGMSHRRSLLRRRSFLRVVSSALVFMCFV